MKRILKKWLAMTLAVLMVMGTLPTTAWAARMETDEVMETPVLDKDDPVADTQGRQDEEERPEPDPDDPDPLPVDPSWRGMTIDQVTLGNTGTWSFRVHCDAAAGKTSGSWAVLIVPDVRSKDKTSTISQLWSQEFGEASEVTSMTSMKGFLTETGLTDGMYGGAGTFTGNFMFGSDGYATISSTMVTEEDIALPDFTTLRNSLANRYVTKDGTAITENTASLPMTVLIYTAQSTTGLALSDGHTYGGGLSDTTWVVNLGDDTINRVNGGQLEAVDDAVWTNNVFGGGTISIPIANTGTERVEFAFSGSTYPANGTKTGLSSLSVTSTAVGINGGATQNITMRLSGDDPGTAVISIPHYTSTGDPDDPYALKGTATITVIVVDSTLPVTASPITFKVTEGKPKTINDVFAAISWVKSDLDPGDETSAYSTQLFVYADADENGFATKSGSYSEGLLFDEGAYAGLSAEVQGEEQTETAYDAEFNEITTYYKVAVSEDEDKNLTQYVNVKLVYAGDLTAADGPYTTNLSITVSEDGGSWLSGTAVVPVTIIVEPGAPTQTYSYALAYDKNAGMDTVNGMPSAPTPVTGTTDTTHTWTLDATATPTRTGYTFKGWAETAGSTTKVTSVTATGTAGTTVTKTVYAIWEINEYTVTYDWNGKTPTNSGVAKPVNANVNHGSNYTVDTSLDTSVVYTTSDGLGWTFGGWSESGNAPEVSSLTNVTANKTLKAIWTAKNYTVSYVKGANGPAAATIANNSKQVQHGAKHTVGTAGGTAVTDVTPGWQFKSWDRTGELTITADTTITAQWQVKVSYALDGGTLSGYPADHWVDYNTADASFPGNPTKSGHTFTGWQDGDGNTVTSATQFTAPTTVTAQWEVNQIKYTFKLNGGNIGGSTDDVVRNQEYNTKLTAPTGMVRTGYKFDGWYDAQTGGNKVTIPATMPAADTTVWAHWTDQYAYKLVYDANGGSGGPAAVAKDWSDNNSHTFTLDFTAANMPARANYTFLGWANANNATSPDYTSAGTKTVTVTGTGHTEAEKTVYAVWSRDQSSVKFTLASATGATWDGTATADKTVTGNTGDPVGTSVPADPRRTGYNFAGWQKTGDAAITAKNQIKYPAAKGATDTYTATWTPINYTITWNANNGKWADNATTKTESCAYDSVITTYGTEPTRTYYDFNGWYTDSACTAANKVTFDKNGPKVTGNLTYYAGWTQKTSNVVVNFQKTPVGGSAAAFSVSGEAALYSGTTATAYKATVSNNNTVKIANVPQGTATYNLYFEGVDTTVDITVIDGTDKSDMAAVTVDFYEMEVKTNDKGTGTVTAANTALVMTAAGVKTTTLSATTTSSTGEKIIVMKGGRVNWSKSATTTNYIFSYWDAAGTTTDPSVASASASASHTATFTKNAFNTYLKLNVNAQPWGTKGTSDTNIREVQLVTANNGNTNVANVTVAYDGTEKVWAATGIASNTTNAQPYWRVTTVDGGIYYTAASVADKTADVGVAAATVTENLFGLVVEDGAGNGTGNKPTLKAQSGSTTRNRIVTRAGNQNTVALNAKAGYTFADWAMKKGLVPAVANTTATDIGDGDSTKYTIAGDYAALDIAPANGDLDLHIMPIYTFSVPVELHYTTATGPLVAGQTVTATGATVANKGSTNTGAFVVSGMTPGTTYNVVVNGYASQLTLDSTMASTTTAQKVVLHKITAAVDPTLAGGTPKVNSTAGATGIYVPNKAAIPGTGATAVTVTVDAAPGAGYRWRNVTGETLWAVTTGTATITTNTAVSTTITRPSVEGDIALTAYAVRQYDATVSVAPTTGGTATFTGAESNGTTIGSPATTAKVDEKSWVKATYIPSVGNTLKGWTVTNGDLYSSSTINASNKITNPATHTGTEVYFVPTADGAKLTANTEAALYEVEIAVNLDNGAYKDSGTNKVQVKIKDGTKEYNLTKKSGSDGVYTVKALPGNYDIYVNGLDISKTVAATDAFDTAKNLNFSANDAEGKDADGNALTDDDDLTAAQAKLKQEINYYTVKLAVSPANASPVNNQVAFASSVANVPSTATGAASVIVLATASTQNISIAAKAYDDGATTHYRFDEWEITQPSGLGTLGHTPTQAAETYTLPDETTLKAKTSGNFNITSDKQITLTASFVQQFKVTVKLASGLNANEVSYLLKEEGETNWAAGKTILVDKDKNVVIYGAFGNSSSTAVENNSRYLSEWTIEGDAATNYGTFDNSNHANTTKPPDGKVGYVIRNGTYTPARDSVLVLNSWQMASLTAGWTYDKGTGAGTSPKPPDDRRSTWTANDGQEPTKVTVQNDTSTAAYNDDLTTSEYQVSNDKLYYTIDKNYLDTTVPVGSYTLKLTYVLGPKDHPNSVTKTASGSFLVLSNKLKLIEVNVKVEDGATTAQPGDNVIYESHQAADIFPYRLEFTWYYADTYPTQQVYTNVAAAEAALPADKVEVPDTNVSGLTVGGGGDNNIIAKGKSDVTDAMKGKYIFAIVTIDTDSDRAEGTVITNAIPVDYDATITVKKDTAAITADYGHYKVYLVPTTLTNPNFGGNLATQGIVEATHVAGTDAAGVFSTKNSGLVGETNYYVYVNDAENTTTHIMKADNTAITPLAHTKDVNYYSVNRVDFTQKHFEDSANVKVGEDFSTGTYAINSVTTGNNSSVADGYGVLSGVSVTAKANTWTQDYDLTWQKKAGNTIVTSGFAFATDGTDDTAEVQNSTNANGTGYANGAVTAKTFIGGRLDQNTYTITGDVKGSGQIASAVLTFKKNETTTYTFNGTVGGNGGNGAIVTFTVPRSNAPAGEITGAYTLKATAKSSSPITTLKGYSVPAGTTATITNDTATLQPLNAGTTGQADNGSKLNNRFTIFVEATELKITVKDDTTPTANTSTASNTATASTGNGDQWKKAFANYNATKGDKMTYDVTIQNNGNAELDVTLVLQKSTDGGSTWTYIYKSGTGGNTLTGTNHDTDTNDVQFTGLADKFSLAVGASKTFKVTIPEDLDNNDDVTYRFNFDTADGRDGYDAPAPTGQYDLKLTIDPVTVASVKTKHPMVGGVEDPNTFEVDVTRIKEDDAVSATDTHSYDQLKKPTKGGSAPDTTNNDLVYEWFYTTWNTEVEFKNGTLVVKGTNTPLTKLSTADGVSTDTLSYTMNATTMGKTLYLLAKGQNNATGAATTPDVINKVDPPMFLPFTGKIKVEEDDVVIATNGTGAGDYKVYLWDKSKGTFDPNNTTHMSQAITTTWVGPTAPGAGDGHFKADNLPSASYNATTKTKKVYEYEVWASRVKGNATLQNTGLTITVDDQVKTVDYYKVQIDNTSVTQGIYEGKLTPAAGSIFLTAATLPKTQPEAATTVDNITVNDDGFVQKGNSVTFTYPDWTKDYTLTWGGSAAASTAQPGASRTTTVTYSSKTTSSVTTVLSLNTYPVVAHVTGPVGKVDSIAMKIKDTEYTFDTIGTAPNILGIGTTVPSATGIAVGNDVTFQLPKATFETKPEVADTAVTAWGYSYNGTTSAMDNTAKTFDVTVSGTNDEYTVMLQGDGLSMTVAETALPTGMNNGATKQSSQASIPDGTGAATSTTINQTIHLNYNYDDDQTVTVQVANGNTDNRSIYNVTWTEVTKNNVSMAGTFTGGEMTQGGTEAVTLNIAGGQAVGSTIDYTADISFTNDDSSKSAKVTYNLTVVVDPLPFTNVTTATDGSTNAKDYTVTPTGGAAITTSTGDTNEATLTGLVHNTDYAYKWVRTAMDVTLTNADVTWAAGAVTLPATAHDCTGTNAATPNYTPNAADQGQKLYLVIYALNNKNATGAAISDPITQGYNGIVYINVDSSRVPSTGTDEPDPGYTVKFISGSETVTGTWNPTLKAYVGSLTPGKDYTVKVSRFAGDATHLIDLAKTLNGTEIGTATTKSNVTEANYFTVNAVALSAKEYKSGTGEDFDYTAGTGGKSKTNTDIKPAFTIGSGADKAALADTTPVLSGQTVAAKAPDLGGANAGKAWTQDYTLTWQANGTGTFVAADDKTPSNVTADNAVKDAGAYSQTVSAKTFIGGRLDQKTYTVTGSINGSGTVKDVTMKGGTGDQLYSLGTAGISHVGTPGITANNTWTDADNNTKQNKGDKYTFTVVKGTYTVTAYEGANTTIRKVTVDASSAAGTTRNTNSLADVETNARTFTIHLEDAGAKLGVKDSDPNNEAYHVSDSTTPNNRDEKVQTYFFSGIPAGNKVDLLLNNPGNVDLKLAAPAVYKVDSGTDYSDSTKLLAAVAAGTAGIVSSSTYTDANIITISNLPAADTAVAIGAAGVAGGTLTVATNAANTADAIYVVKFASTYDDTEGNHLTGPTVYYVFDLTVDPLPIVDVEAEFQTGSTSVLQLKDYDGTNAASGLANVTVSTDGTSTATTDAVTAKLLDTTANADITYVWAVSDKNNLTAADFEINASNKIVAKVAGTATVDSATGSKTRTITAAEQGKYLYLIAYRVDGNKNASGFAVSEAMYAPVEVAIKAYQTGHATGLTDVTVTGKLGETTKTSNDGVITAPNAGGTINFTADNADNATPASAKYYFVGWGVSPADAATVPTVRNLTWNYPVTKNSTVIGYYDLLPELTGASGCIIGAATIPDTARTFTYKPNDGSGNVVIMIKPDTGSKFHATGATGEDLTSARELNATAFELIAGLPNTSGTIGAQGAYRLTDSWIKDNLDGEQTYIITFYDKGKGQYSDPKTGAANAGGYAGYDRWIKFETSLGEKAVTAVVAVADQGHGNTVQVTGGTPAGAVAETSNAETLNGAVTLHAHPGNGYVFDYWEITTGTGSFADPNGDKLKEPVYRPKMMEETVTAHFKAGTLSMEDVTASIIYGTTAFEGGTPPSVTATSTATGAAFTYAEATAAELAAAGITDPNVTAIPTGWLTLNTNGTFTVTSKAATNVESSTTGTYTAVDNELVIYVKATETNTGATIIKKVTIDVKPAELVIQNPITGAGYKNAYEAVGGENKPINHGDPVVLKYFTYDDVRNTKNTADVVDNGDNAGTGVTHSMGYWSVAPTTFDGTGDNDYVDGGDVTNSNSYTFTFNYTGDPDDHADDWNYTNAEAEINIEALAPAISLKFADEMADSGNPATTTKPFDVTQGTDYSDHTGSSTTTSGAPLKLNYSAEAKRKNESITYLDREPVYHVSLQKIGSIDSIKLAVDDTTLNGFATVNMPSSVTPTSSEAGSTQTWEFDVKLTNLKVDSKRWAGDHTIKITATGHTTDGTEVEATYELKIVVDPKVIDKLTVEARPTQSTPTSVVAQSGGTNLPTTDTKGNKPIKNAHADWTVTHSEPTQVEVTVEIDPNYKYVDPLDAGNVDMTVTGKSIPDPGVTRNRDTLVTITQPIPTLMHDDAKNEEGGGTSDARGPAIYHTRTVTVAPGTEGNTLGSYTINLGAYGAAVHNVTWTIEGNDTLTTAGATLTGLPAGTFDLTKDTKRTVTLDLTGFTGELTAGKRYSLSLKAAGKANATDAEANIISTYVFTLQVSTPSSPGGPVEPACPCKVFYHVGIHGTTADPTVEDVSENGTPAAPPTVTALEGYVFKGWSLTNPANLKEGEKAELVDPKTVKAKGETMIFYAVLQVYVRPFHQHYVIGYPNGTFGPADDINRASVATIIARAVLPGFVEGADYGNPGGYSDVEGHWAESAIAYCSKFGVFEGMPDGTFQPDRPITRQELAVAVARLDGILEPGEMSFTDIDEAGDWAMGGIYTAYTKGWVNGYPDGSFKPLNNIRRDEAVKLFNAYLNRGVDAEGLSDLKEYVHSGVASNNTENGENEYMTWPDVPKDQWAYYEIIEAANDHEYRVDDDGNYTVPEHWEKCWIDERWRYGDDPAGAAANAGAAVSAGFRVWFD